MKTLTLFVTLFFSSIAFCQVNDYSDVAVIVNDNSQSSIAIGNYFQQARNIPNQNMIHIFAPTQEDIDSTQFEQLRAQIENHLVSNNLVDSINYLVTTKGVPLKMSGGCGNMPPPNQLCGSVDGKLALILGQHSNYIYNGYAYNPYYDNVADDAFERSTYNIYLVTRLDGYTQQDVFDLIDRSGPNTGVNKLSSQNVVNMYNTVSSGDSTYFSLYHLEPTYDLLLNDSWNVQSDYSMTTLSNVENVFTCVQQATFPPSNVSTNYSWVEGSICMVPSCASARTFLDSNNSQGELLIADVIREGCTAAFGTTGSIYFSEIFPSNHFLERYLDVNLDYNLAESFYSEIHRLSRHWVIIGDPKASVVVDNLASAPELENIELSVYPNPSSGLITVRSSETIHSYSIFSLAGNMVHEDSGYFEDQFAIDLSEIPSGVYLLNLKTSTHTVQRKIVLTD